MASVGIVRLSVRLFDSEVHCRTNSVAYQGLIAWPLQTINPRSFYSVTFSNNETE